MTLVRKPNPKGKLKKLLCIQNWEHQLIIEGKGTYSNCKIDPINFDKAKNHYHVLNADTLGQA